MVIPEYTILETVNSTNDYLKILASKGAPEGKVIIAREQTAGKGRMGRSFFSPKSTGIYMSFLLRPAWTMKDISLITPMAASATAKAIEALTGGEVKIKWVNDLYIEGRKVCGILTETAMSDNRTIYAIVGIGINITPPENGFPDDIKERAGAISEEMTADKDFPLTLCKEIVENFFELYSKEDIRFFVKDYIKKSFVIGKEITVIDGNKLYDAKATDIDNDCRLIVKKSDGEEIALYSGEISIKLK